jgi:hypothetical protein
MRQNNIIGGILNPLHLTPALWIDFSDSSKVTLNGSTISQVDDKSASALNFTQAVALNQPSYESAVQNGLNVARFDGSNDRLTRSTSDLARNVGGLTIYAIRKWSASPTAARNIFSISTNVAGNGRALLFGGFVSNKMGAGGRRLDANTFASIAASSNIGTTSFDLDTAVFDYTNSDLYLYTKDVLEASTTTFQTTGSTSNTAATAAAIGSQPNGSGQYFEGDIGEVLVYHSAHDAATRQRVWDYLRTKWGI